MVTSNNSKLMHLKVNKMKPTSVYIRFECIFCLVFFLVFAFEQLIFFKLLLSCTVNWHQWPAIKFTHSFSPCALSSSSRQCWFSRGKSFVIHYTQIIWSGLIKARSVLFVCNCCRYGMDCMLESTQSKYSIFVVEVQNEIVREKEKKFLFKLWTQVNNWALSENR